MGEDPFYGYGSHKAWRYGLAGLGEPGFDADAEWRRWKEYHRYCLTATESVRRAEVDTGYHPDPDEAVRAWSVAFLDLVVRVAPTENPRVRRVARYCAAVIALPADRMLPLDEQKWEWFWAQSYEPSDAEDCERLIRSYHPSGAQKAMRRLLGR